MWIIVTKCLTSTTYWSTLVVDDKSYIDCLTKEGSMASMAQAIGSILRPLSDAVHHQRFQIRWDFEFGAL